MDPTPSIENFQAHFLKENLRYTPPWKPWWFWMVLGDDPAFLKRGPVCKFSGVFWVFWNSKKLIVVAWMRFLRWFFFGFDPMGWKSACFTTNLGEYLVFFAGILGKSKVGFVSVQGYLQSTPPCFCGCSSPIQRYRNSTKKCKKRKHLVHKVCNKKWSYV